MRRSCLAFALAAFIAAPAAAQDADDEAAQAASRADLVSILDRNFKGVDTNGDGTLAKPEMEAAAARIAERRVEQRFKALDTNKDSMISLAEFRLLADSVRAGSGTVAAIQRLDSNGDGKVSGDEFRSPLLTQFDRLDSDKNGQLSAAERARAPAPRPEGR